MSEKKLELNALLRLYVKGYLSIMLFTLLLYAIVSFPFIKVFPFNCFFGILVASHVACLIFVCRMPHIRIKAIFITHVCLSLAAVSPLAIMSHVMGCSNIYAWMLIVPVKIFVLFPELKLARRIFFCGCILLLTICLMGVSELLVSMFHDQIVSRYSHLYGRNYTLINGLSLILPIVMVFVVLCFFMFLQLRIGQVKRLAEKTESKDKRESAPTEENKNAEARYSELYDNIVALFETEKCYLDPRLSISQLSSLLNTNVAYVARAIKQRRNMNFKAFVNLYRIEAAKEMIRRNPEYTIEYIYSSSGFSNQSNFNKVFRQTEGITPGEFRETNNVKV